MASKGGISADRVGERLADRVRQFAFFQLVHLLERSTGGVPLGYQGPARRERIRFRAEPSLAFPPCDVTRLRRLPAAGSEPDRYELTVSFMGLYGSASPLPAHYTEAVIAADLDSTNRRDFLDYFHQRLISFFYRVWKKYRYYANYRPGAGDAFSQRAFSLFGVRSPTLREGVQLDWARLLASGGLLTMTSAPADAVERTVGHYFDGLATRVEPYVAHTVRLEREQRASLGLANVTLGEDLTIGRTVRDRAGKFWLVLGPMSWPQLDRFLPTGADFAGVVALVAFMLTDALAFDLLLLILRREARRLEIGRHNPCRLGWTTWLGVPHEEVLAIRLRTA